MELGFTTMNTPEDVGPADLARTLEDLGFTSLWIGEHSHIPASRQTPYPAGGDLPPAYRRMMDPFLSLLAAAQATTSLRIGTGVALPLEHDVFQLAKTVTTLDHLSGGRFDFGVGVGWNVEQLADHRPDIPWRARYQALAECVAALRVLWCDEDAAVPRPLVRLRRGVGRAEAAAGTPPADRRWHGGSAGHAARRRVGRSVDARGPGDR